MNSVKTRLGIAVGLLACAGVAAVAVTLRQGTRVEFFRLQELERRDHFAALRDRTVDLASRIDRRCCSAAMLVEIARQLDEQQVAVIVKSDGTLVAWTQATPEPPARAPPETGPPIRPFRNLKTRREGPALILEADRVTGPVANRLAFRFEGTGVPLHLESGAGAELHLVRLPQPQDEGRTEAFLGALDRRVLSTAMVCGIAAMGLTWLLARRALTPVNRLREGARALASGRLTHRVPVASDDELGDLARAFNAMAAELERQETLRRDLLRDVAHELRTPLTALRCRVETITDGLSTDVQGALRGAQEEVVHLSHLVDDLEELALAEARELKLDVADVQVAPVIASALAAARLEGDQRMRVDVPPDLHAHVDPIRFRQVLVNLLTNADRHAVEPRSIEVSARREPGAVVVEVSNTGSALTDEQRSRVFDRFYRTDPARQRSTGGAGLGLAIVKTLVEAQGGRVWVRSGDDTVTFGFAVPSSPRQLSGAAAEDPPGRAVSG